MLKNYEYSRLLCILSFAQGIFLAAVTLFLVVCSVQNYSSVKDLINFFSFLIFLIGLLNLYVLIRKICYLSHTIGESPYEKLIGVEPDIWFMGLVSSVLMIIIFNPFFSFIEYLYIRMLSGGENAISYVSFPSMVLILSSAACFFISSNLNKMLKQSNTR